MAKNPVALGHFGLLLGLLAVITELNQWLVVSSPVSGTATAAFFAALIVWVIGAVLVVIEWFQSPAST